MYYIRNIKLISLFDTNRNLQVDIVLIKKYFKKVRDFRSSPYSHRDGRKFGTETLSRVFFGAEHRTKVSQSRSVNTHNLNTGSVIHSYG